jgi:glycosyltransferase involved in cell wall biosynthesis
VPELGIDNPMPPWFGVDEMARLVRGAALSLYPTVPTGHGFCLYIRRDCLDEVGALDEAAFPRGYGEENDLCMRAGRAGWENVLDDRTFVWHQRSASFGAEKSGLSAAGGLVVDERYPEYRALITLFEKDPAILAVRWRVRRALAKARATGAVPRPRVLFVISTESGGTPQTNRDLMDALSDRYEPWVLRCDSRVLTLSRHIPAELRAEGGPVAEPVEEHRLERRIAPTTHGSAEYDRIAADLILRHGFELVHVRHIAWHGTGLTRVCQRLGVPVVFSFHDFYTACPVTKLLDAEGRFCGGPCTEGEADCTAELWPAESVPPLRHRFVHRWQEMMAEALRACDAFVTTSPSAQRTMVGNFPFLAERDFRLIPHGRSFARMEGLGAEPSLDEKLRVLVPGNVSGSKGGGLVAAMAAIDRGRQVEFHVLGGVDSALANAPGIVLHGRYDRADFAAHVARIRPHLGAVLSLWPETYCHTLTECWAAGLPVMATALGALAERIGESGGGWLVDRWMEPEAMLAELLRLRRDPAEVRARRDEVLDWQARTGRHGTTTAMAAEYDRLYREVLDRRRAFRAEPERPRVVLTLDAPHGALPSPLAAATRNAVSRPFIFRPILPSFPFGSPSADAVLVAPDALPAGDLAALRQRCAAIGLPVIEAPVGGPGTGERDESVFLGEGLETASWLSEGPPAAPGAAPGAASAAGPDAGAPCRVVFAATGDDAQLAALHPVFEDLAALGVATLCVLGAVPAAWYQAIGIEGADGVAALRRAARDHHLGIAHAGPALLAMQAAELPVLAIPPALAGDDPAAADLARDALLRQVAELSVDTPRRVALGREGRRTARAAMLAHPAGQGVDLRLRALLRDRPAPPPPESEEEARYGLVSEGPVA